MENNIPCGNCHYPKTECCSCDYERLMTIEEKYRWHDLRKNPDDLPYNPDEEQICLVKHIEMMKDIYGEDFEYYAYSTATYDGTRFNFGVGFEETDNQVMNVIAWREIEPFEEE